MRIRLGLWPVSVLLLLPIPCSAQTVTGSLTITGSPLTLTIPAVHADQNVAFSAQLGANGGTGQGYTFSKVSGAFPAGINDVTSAGLVSGTPTGVSAGTEVVKLCDSSGTCVQVAVTITPVALSSIAVTPASQSIQGSATLNLTATCTWADTTTSNCTSIATWANTGTPGGSLAYSAPFEVYTASVTSGTETIKATLSSITDDGGSGISVTVSTSGSVTISNASLPNGQINQPYPESSGQGVQLNATGGTAPYTWSITSGSLQAGLALSSSGLISGTPTASGASGTITFKVTDSASNTATANLTVTVASLSSVAISPTTPSIPAGGTQQFKLTGTYSDSSTADVTNQVTGGSAGLKLVGKSGCSWNTSNTGCTTGSLPGNAGDLYHVCAETGSTTLNTPTDSGSGATFTAVAAQNNQGSLNGRCWDAPNISANANETISCSTTSSTTVGTCIALEYSGAATSSPVDTGSTQTAANAGSCVAASTTMTNANDAIVNWCAVNSSSATLSPSGGFTSETPSGSSPNSTSIADQIVTSAYTGTPGFTWTPSGNLNTLEWVTGIKAAGTSSGWSSGTPGVATINGTGLATATGMGGTSTIQGCIGATCSSTTLTVNAPSDTAISVSPSGASVIEGGSQQFTAKGNNTGNVLTATWAVSPTSCGSITAGGLYTAPASSTCTATINAVAGSLTCSGADGTCGSVTVVSSTQGALLTGYTVTSSNTMSGSTPAGWTFVCAEGFDGSGPGCPNEYTSANTQTAATVTTNNPHTGAKSLQCSIKFDSEDCLVGMVQGTIGASTHIYVSFSRYMVPPACGDVEIYFWDVYHSSGSGSRNDLFDVMDTQNYSNPFNNCVTTMTATMLFDAPNPILPTITGSNWNLPIGVWEQVEGEFKASTCTGSSSNNDGIARLWVNGVQKFNKTNVNLNNCGTTVSGMAVEAGGLFTFENSSGQSIAPPGGSFTVYLDDVIFLRQ